MGDLKVLGIDIAKNIFQVHGTDKTGHKLFSKRLSRKKLPEFIANLKPCLIGMEACGSAHYWARKFKQMGHDVKLMAPKYVKPYVTGSKNDMRDAEAIAEAVTRPKTRFIPQKSIEQQDIQALHRVRQQLIKQRTMQSNQIRGLLAEYGIIIPKGISHIRSKLFLIIENAENELTMMSRSLFNDMHEQFKQLDHNISEYDKKINTIAKENEKCRRLLDIDGLGPITATALISTIGDIGVFKNGRHLAAYLGLVPQQKSSGDKIVLQGISKRGNRYLRTLLIHGARTVLKYSDKKTDKHSQWINKKKSNAGTNVTAVAIANKHARYVWAELAKNESYQKDYVPYNTRYPQGPQVCCEPL